MADDMTDAHPTGASPYLPPTDVGADENRQFTNDVVEPLYRRRLWFRLLGVLLIIAGALFSLTIIGILFGVPMIIAGIFFYQAAGHYEAGFRGDIGRWGQGSDKLSLAILMSAVAVGVVTLLMLLYFGLIFGMLLIGAVSNVAYEMGP